MQFIINGTCSFMSSLTLLSQTLSSVVHTSNKKKSNGESSGCLQKDENNKKFQNRHPKSGRCRFREVVVYMKVPTVMI